MRILRSADRLVPGEDREGGSRSSAVPFGRSSSGSIPAPPSSSPTLPYLYSTYENESESQPTSRRKLMILGSGPNRIGQGIEFDYCCCQAAFTLREAGVECIMVNCNPETVSTDYDTSDRLYFEPLTLEDVLHIVRGGAARGRHPPVRRTDAAEARARPRARGGSDPGNDPRQHRRRRGSTPLLLAPEGSRHPPARERHRAVDGGGVRGRASPAATRSSSDRRTFSAAAAWPSSTTTSGCESYFQEAVAASPEHPVYIDRFLEAAFEVDVDAISDGEDVVIGGIMEHIEEAGIHSGDSSCVLPHVPRRGEGARHHPLPHAADRESALGERAPQRPVRGQGGQGLRSRGEPARFEDRPLREQGHRRSPGEGRASRDARREARLPRASAGASGPPRGGEGPGAALRQVHRGRYAPRPGDEIHGGGHGGLRRFRDGFRQGSDCRRAEPPHRRERRFSR